MVYSEYADVVNEFGGELVDYWTESRVDTWLLVKIYNKINSELAPYFEVPFDNATKHSKGVPPEIDELASEAAKLFILMTETSDHSPNMTPSIELWDDFIERKLAKIKLIAKDENYAELLYSDGTIVARKTTQPSSVVNRAEHSLVKIWTQIDDDGIDSNDYYDGT